MWVTATMIAKEIGVSPRTIMDHVRKMEKEGYHVKAKIGRPAQINRDIFMSYVYGSGWGDKDGKTK